MDSNQIALKQIALGFTDRAALVGTTGCGKTTLAEQLANLRENVVVYDYKGQLKWAGYKRFTTLKKLTQQRAGRFIYVPSAEAARDKDAIEQFFDFVYRRGNTRLVVDEVTSVSDQYFFPDRYRDVLARGREFNISVLNCTQRPAEIPMQVLSESEYFYMFWLKLEQDRKRMHTVTGIEEEYLMSLPKHQFYYATLQDIKGPLRVKLNEKKAA